MRRSSGRAVAVASACAFAAFVGLALTGVAQIVSLHGWCDGDAELQLDSTPAVLCRDGSATLELPISPSVVAIVCAVAGAAISSFIVVRTARAARDA